MLFSDLTKQRYSSAILTADGYDGVTSLSAIEQLYGLDIGISNAQGLRVASREELDAPDGITKFTHDASVSTVGVFCFPEKVDMAKKTSGRTWLSRIIQKFEAEKWVVVDGLVDSQRHTFIAAFAPAKSSTASTASTATQFWYQDRLVSLTFACDTDVMRLKSVLSGSFYERYMLENIRHNYTGGDIVDIGANIGNHTIFFGLIAQEKQARVHAIEPAPASLELLRRNISANHLDNLVTVSPIAAGEEVGRVFLRPGSASNHLGAMRIVATGESAGSIEAPISLLDEIIPFERPVAIIKIDVEGYEVPALRGARRLIETWRPELYVEAGAQAGLDEIQNFLLPLGYERKAVFNDTPTYWFAHSDGRKVG
jgi:FkbM family methyltransferase